MIDQDDHTTSAPARKTDPRDGFESAWASIMDSHPEAIRPHRVGGAYGIATLTAAYAWWMTGQGRSGEVPREALAIARIQARIEED